MPVASPFYRLGGFFTCAIAAAFCSPPALATDVTMRTPLGDIPIELFDETAPVTVANFLKYLRDGDYDYSFVHRSVLGFVIQGGGYTFINNIVANVPADPPIVNESELSNIRGTIAMAKLPGNPNSATSQWFINLKDNSAPLDTDNGGYTVFGQVTGNGMAVVDAINALPIWNAGSPFSELPLINFSNTSPIAASNLVFTTITEDSDFLINSGLNDAWYDPATPGQGFFINVFPDSGSVFLAWFTYDITRPAASVTAELGDPGHRWMTAFGPYEGNTAELDIEVTEGGVFDATNPVPTTDLDGDIVLEVTDCEHASVIYNIPSAGKQGIVRIKRISLDNVARCEQLASDAAAAD